MKFYSKKDPENLSVVFIYFIFVFIKTGASIFLLLLIVDPQWLQMHFTLFIRSMQCKVKWWQCRRQWDVSFISRLQEHTWFMHSWKCLNLCSFRWLKPKRKRVNSFNPSGAKMSRILFCTRRIKDNNLLLKIEIDSEFLTLTSRLNQSFQVHGKNEYVKQSVLQL